MGNWWYVYKKEDLSQKELYQKKWMLSFVKDQGYLAGDIYQDEAGRKFLKLLIDTRLLMHAHTRDERRLFW